jgi:hypothetical protein
MEIIITCLCNEATIAVKKRADVKKRGSRCQIIAGHFEFLHIFMTLDLRDIQS